jgi:hypothetical protein
MKQTLVPRSAALLFPLWRTKQNRRQIASTLKQKIALRKSVYHGNMRGSPHTYPLSVRFVRRINLHYDILSRSSRVRVTVPTPTPSCFAMARMLVPLRRNSKPPPVGMADSQLPPLEVDGVTLKRNCVPRFAIEPHPYRPKPRPVKHATIGPWLVACRCRTPRSCCGRGRRLSPARRPHSRSGGFRAPSDRVCRPVVDRTCPVERP